ncbi:hypothetical protein E2C01_006615 [Portunus trituberculatus]|uniref:Uncharacterized protein n=1 Tax=Portunus trituberculatus TaxID=210409 RepID=A0A5B7D001_PORTR|nr:hypothetical protein [Portunus trituberculatus]
MFPVTARHPRNSPIAPCSTSQALRYLRSAACRHVLLGEGGEAERLSRYITTSSAIKALWGKVTVSRINHYTLTVFNMKGIYIPTTIFDMNDM